MEDNFIEEQKELKYSLSWANSIFERFYEKYSRASDLYAKKRPEASRRAIFDLAKGNKYWKKYTREVKKLAKQNALDF